MAINEWRHTTSLLLTEAKRGRINRADRAPNGDGQAFSVAQTGQLSTFLPTNPEVRLKVHSHRTVCSNRNDISRNCRIRFGRWPQAKRQREALI